MRKFILVMIAVCAAAACGASEAPSASENAKRYPLRGRVISVDKAAKKAKVEHEKIEGFMDKMTMDFPIHADWVWDELSPGAELRADLVVDSSAKEPYWLENIGIVSAPKPGQPVPSVNENFAQIGNEVPNFSLTNQDGRQIAITDFRGKALAITFIYSRCPLPDYCIRMSTAFSDAAIQLRSDPEWKDRIRLLSVSFDPEYDTPQKLRSYGIGYLGNQGTPDFTQWQLAVGKDAEVRRMAEFFGLRYEVDENDKTQINHSLRTAVIAPDGKLVRIFPGSDWTTSELLTALKSTFE